MWISYLDVFISVLSAYDVYEKKDCPVYLTYNTTKYIFFIIDPYYH